MLEFGTGYKASTVSVSQEILQKLGQLANGNVMIQMMTHPHASDPAGAAYRARYKCTKCNAAEIIPMDVLFDEDLLLKSMEWCKAHRHEAPKKFTVKVNPENLLEEAGRSLRIVE